MNTTATPPHPQQARILVFTGDGKGKTTAAMGMALRAAGHNMQTCILQFLKQDSRTGEIAAFQHFPHVDIRQVGAGFVPKEGHPQFSHHQQAAQRGLQTATEVIASHKCKLIVLDEICTAVSLKLLSEHDVLKLISETQPGTILVLTGRGATPGMCDKADTVTEMQCVKHGMYGGHPAQAGCEH